MSHSRRDFLKTIGYGAAGLALAGAVIRGLSEGFPKSSKYMFAGAESSICRVNLHDWTVNSIDIYFRPHSFLAIPGDVDRVWAIQKWGAMAALANFKTGKIEFFLTCPEDYAFYGHGIHDLREDMVLLSRVDLTNGTGHLVGFRPGNENPVIDYKVTPGFLHEVRRLADGTVLVASAGMRVLKGEDPRSGPRIAPSSLVRVDLSSGAILNEYKLDNPDLLIQHFAITDNQQVIAASAVRKWGKTIYGGVFILKTLEGQLEELTIPEAIANEAQYTEEMLSVAVDNHSTVAAVTNPTSRTVTLFDLKTAKWMNTVRTGEMSGAAYENSTGCFMLEGKDGLIRLNPASGKYESINAVDFDAQTFSSAHTLLI